MKITILGSGSAYGIPMIFNTWGRADSSNPQNKRTRASLFLEIDNKNILIDAGPELRQQINANNIKNIDSVFITHGHYDHIAGIPELPRAAKILNHSIDIYASAETMAELTRCYNYLFINKADAEPDSKSLLWHTLPDKGNFFAAGLEFMTAQFPHHNLHSSAFRYKNFAYVTDWQDFPPDIDDFLNNLELLIVECNNGLNCEQNGHSDITKINQLIQKYHPRHIILSHISHRVDASEFAKNLPLQCQLAYDGQVLEI